ncbi:dTMP kinase [Leptotrichia sp. HSP-536]|uniref:dTMP kinase n=1 Tax=Leptotrichia alba TaxID=3239304 RepID=A0AB39V649_9FUSO
MGKLIIIEGTDGSGKQTQTELLYKKLKEIKGEEKVKKISFPNYESRASEPVKMYLAGEFGKTAESVNAYAASVLYSIDRFASFKTEWEEFYNNGGIVISDRYTISNMIHQVPKILDENEKEKYLEWLVDLEWRKIGIPKPDIVFFLDIPFEFSQKLMKNRENKITGEKKKDIHEKDGNYLKNAYETAKELSVKYGWNVISCVNRDKLRTREDINNEMIKITLENI